MNVYLDLNDDLFHAEDKEILKYLKKSLESKSAKDRIKYANKALKLNPNSIDAKLLLVSGSDMFEMIEQLKIVVEEERKRLTELGILRKKNMGSLSSISEGASYIEALVQLLLYYIDIGGYRQALNLVLEIERLDEEYYVRFHSLAIALYAYFEDEEKINKLCKKCDRPCFVYIMSLMILYYRRGNFKKAREYLEKLNQMNSSFIPYFKGEKVLGKEGNFVKNAVNNFDFLFLCAPHIDEFIIK